MPYELTFLGALIGLLAGFFGIGGGLILIPSLLFLGFDMKSAVGISVIQMVFTSFYGSYLNFKKGTLDVKLVLVIGVGGMVGAQSSGFILSFLSAMALEIIFLFFVIFAFYRLAFSKIIDSSTTREVSVPLLFIIGAGIGAFSISMGVGGSILLVPILVSFLHVPLKKAISAGLFFVLFASSSGLISLSYNTTLDFLSGVTIGIGSLVGVYIGIHYKDRVEERLQKKLLLFMYIVVSVYIFTRLFING
ncbi:MAG: TSUP family transporter [Helicobacteraceae bacterium]|nr:TSUP family transporter [Helicobacteraceae bacterium]